MYNFGLPSFRATNNWLGIQSAVIASASAHPLSVLLQVEIGADGAAWKATVTENTCNCKSELLSNIERLKAEFLALKRHECPASSVDASMVPPYHWTSSCAIT